jgi:hypothetical protein
MYDCSILYAVFIYIRIRRNEHFENREGEEGNFMDRCIFLLSLFSLDEKQGESDTIVWLVGNKTSGLRIVYLVNVLSFLSGRYLHFKAEFHADQRLNYSIGYVFFFEIF